MSHSIEGKNVMSTGLAIFGLGFPIMVSAAFASSYVVIGIGFAVCILGLIIIVIGKATHKAPESNRAQSGQRSDVTSPTPAKPAAWGRVAFFGFLSAAALMVAVLGLLIASW